MTPEAFIPEGGSALYVFALPKPDSVPSSSADDGYTLRTAAAIASHASRRTRRDEATFIRMWPSPPLP